MSYSLNLNEVTYALSGALDLVGIDDNMHGKRVAYMAVEIAKKLAWPQQDIHELYSLGMLHDCGVSSTDVHSHLISELDWNNSEVHCIRGEELLLQTSIYSKYASYVRFHHTHWDSLANTLSEDVKNKANLIYLVDRVDALRAQLQDMNSEHIKAIQDITIKYADKMFKREFVETFLELSSRDSFWFFLEPEALSEYCLEWVQKGVDELISFEKLKEIGLMFAAVVDAKSVFTSEHSLGVSALATYLAQLHGLSSKKCEIIELTALLHDLGKLKVDDKILNKPASLSENERLKMNKHGFDSYVILKHIKGFDEISYLASLHHETLDGHGYPYGFSQSQIPLEARVIAVADIFQALIQNRPYRGGLSAKDAFEIIQSMSDDNKLDKSVVKMLEEHLDEAYKRAIIC